MSAWNVAESSLYGWLLKQTGNAQEAEDILQEVFLKAMRNSDRFCTLQDGKSWLFQITKNHLIDTFRQKKRTIELGDYPTQTEVSPALAQLQQCLPRVLSRLGKSERDIIEQCDLNGMPQKEYAERHSLSLPAVKARLRRARITLREALITECKITRDEAGKVCCFASFEPTG
jgi:RNA polymerase sigma-70 factor (ECF subfamily)